MNQISLKKIFIVLVVIFLLSQSGKLIRFFTNLKLEGLFFDSMEPLRKSPVEARYVLTLLLFALIYITIFKLLQNRK